MTPEEVNAKADKLGLKLIRATGPEPHYFLEDAEGHWFHGGTDGGEVDEGAPSDLPAISRWLDRLLAEKSEDQTER